MVNLVARILASLATAGGCAYGTGFVAAGWAAGPGHAADAVAALLVCLIFAAASILIALDVALDLRDGHRLREDLKQQRHVLDRLSALG